MGKSRVLQGTLLFLSFAAVAAVQAWPLPLRLATHLPGNPGGDTGVYVWNHWVFRHEVLQGHWPFWTDRILSSTGPVNLSLHNYTVWSNLLALALQAWLDVVTVFNLVYLTNVALAGIGMSLLALRLWRRTTMSAGAAWLAGVLFACSPFLVARGTAHFSLVAAAALPFFVLAFDRAWHSGRRLDAAAVGLTFAWAAYSDPYYAVYCLVLALAVAVGHVANVARQRRQATRLGTRAVDLGIAVGAILVAAIASGAVDRLTIGAATVSLHSLYTPVLFLTTMVCARVALAVRPTITWRSGSLPSNPIGSIAVSGLVALVLLSPLIVAIVTRVIDGRLVRAPVLWRSSAPGVDLISFFLPNPNHPLTPQAIVDWVSAQPGQFEENVVSIPWVAIAVILIARLVMGHWSTRLWLGVAVGAAAIAVGPFLRIAGVETYVPSPWAFLRYLPVLGEARMPARFGAVLAMAVALLVAGALSSLCLRFPAHRRRILAVVGLLLAFELWPAPRALYSAHIPSFYDVIAADRRPVSVLMLPVGVRDGLSSLGDFSAISQFYQTRHTKPLIGGYLSRVSDRRREAFLSHPFLAALTAKSERKTLTPEERSAARSDAAAFVRDVRLGYVVIDQWRTTDALRDLAISALHLREIATDGTLHLYEVGEETWAGAQ